MPIDPKRILYKDDHFLAVHKLSGELSVKGKGAVDKLPLYDFLRKDFPGIRPVNRLDFDTSGVMIFARTKEALASVMPPSPPRPPSPDGGGGRAERNNDASFSRGERVGNGRENKANSKAPLPPIGGGVGGEGGPGDNDFDIAWKKTYRTFVTGNLPKAHGEIHFPLPARTGHKLIPAHTAYKVLESFPDCTYVETEITSGRHHQIRRHFAKIAHPLILDDLYGNRDYNRGFSKAHKYRKFFLHAFSVEFVHPFTKEKVRIEAPLPKVFEVLLKKLRKS